MKKIIAAVLLIVMAVGLAACSGDESGGDLVKVGDNAINEKQLNQYVAFNSLSGVDITKLRMKS